MLFSGFLSFCSFLSRVAVCAALLFSFHTPAAAGVVAVDATSRGCYKGAGTTFCSQSGTATGNYFLGHVPGPGEIRNYFSFDLTGLYGPVLGAALRIDTRGSVVDYFSLDATETFSLFDVDSGTVVGSSIGTSGFADLGGGVSYGSADVSEALTGTTLQIELNAAALADIVTAGGGFSIGGALTTLAGGADRESIFGSTAGAAYRVQLVLTTVEHQADLHLPAPESLAVLGGGLLAFAFIRRKAS